MSRGKFVNLFELISGAVWTPKQSYALSWMLQSVAFNNAIREKKKKKKREKTTQILMN